MTLHKPLILSIYISSLTTALVNTAILILLPLYMLDLGYSVATASFIVALRGLGLLCFDVPAGLIANRIGDKATLLLGTIILVSSSGLLAISQSLGAIALATMFLGASTSLVTIGRRSYITDSTTINKRGRVIAAWASMFRVGHPTRPITLFNSEHGHTTANVTSDIDINQGVVAMSHGWGELDKSEGTTVNGNVNLLINNAVNFSPINANEF